MSKSLMLGMFFTIALVISYIPIYQYVRSKYKVRGIGGRYFQGIIELILIILCMVSPGLVAILFINFGVDIGKSVFNLFLYTLLSVILAGTIFIFIK